MTEQESRIWDAVYAAEFQVCLYNAELHLSNRYSSTFNLSHTEYGYEAAERARCRADEAVIRLRETAPYYVSRI